MSVLPFPRRRPDPDLGRHLSAAELADRWHRHVDTIRRMPADEMPFIKLGRSKLYRIADVLAYEEARFVTEED